MEIEEDYRAAGLVAKWLLNHMTFSPLWCPSVPFLLFHTKQEFSTIKLVLQVWLFNRYYSCK